MELITPSFGLIFWMLIGFGILFFILAKYAWPVITGMIKKRETFIQDQLQAAEKVRQEMQNLQNEQQVLLNQAKEERDQILIDARKVREKMYEDAKLKIEQETQTMITEAREQIKNEKMKAMFEIKSEVGALCIEISEKIIAEELSSREKQEDFIRKCLTEKGLN